MGDFVTKGSENTVYEVVHLTREPITDYQYQAWLKENTRYGSQRDKFMQDLIDKYKKSGNFGACQIHCKPIVRGGKQIAKGRLLKWLEPDFPNYKYNGYRKTTLEDLIKHRQNNIGNVDYQINKFMAKRKIQEDALKVLEAVYDYKNPKPVVITPAVVETTKIQVTMDDGSLVDLEPSSLL